MFVRHSFFSLSGKVRFLFVVEEVVSSLDELKTRTTPLWSQAGVAAVKFGFALTRPYQ